MSTKRISDLLDQYNVHPIEKIIIGIVLLTIIAWLVLQ